jgi:hypothetical protein
MAFKRLSSLWRLFRANFVIAFVLLSVVFVDVFVLFLLQEKANEIKRELIRANKIDELDQSSAVADRILDAIDASFPPKKSSDRGGLLFSARTICSIPDGIRSFYRSQREDPREQAHLHS